MDGPEYDAELAARNVAALEDDVHERDKRIAELEKDVTDMDEAHELRGHMIDALEAMLKRTAQALDPCARTGMLLWFLEFVEEARALLRKGTR